MPQPAEVGSRDGEVRLRGRELPPVAAGPDLGFLPSCQAASGSGLQLVRDRPGDPTLRVRWLLAVHAGGLARKS